MLSLRHFIFVSTAIKWFIILLGWYFIIKLCYLSYDYVMVNKSFFIQGQTHQDIVKHLIGVFDRNLDGAKEILRYYFGEIFLTYLVKTLICFFALFLYKRIPLPNMMIAKWHQNGEIDAIFGRRLVYWLRWQTHFQLKQFLECYRFSRIEKGHVNYHANRKLSPLFERFDANFNKDKTIK